MSSKESSARTPVDIKKHVLAFMAALNKQSTFVEPLQDELEMGKGEDQDYDDQNDGVEEFALGTVEEEQAPKPSKQESIQINE